MPLKHIRKLLFVGLTCAIIVLLCSKALVEGKRSAAVTNNPSLQSCQQSQPLNFTSVNISDDHPAVSIIDSNNDGKQDVLIVNHSLSSVSLLLGDSSNSYTSVRDFPCGRGTSDIITADFNNDGNVDFATANQLSSTISIYLGNGEGSFIRKNDIAIHGSPRAIKVGNMNSDNNTDIVVTTVAADDDFVIVLLGNGTGEFAEFDRETVSASPENMAIGDFNADGKQDVLVVEANRSTVRLLRGDGTGKLESVRRIATPSLPTKIVAGDLNTDNKLDFVVIDDVNEYTIFYGDGNGDFPVQTSIPTSSLVADIAVADYNNDGRLDIIALMTRPSRVGVFIASPSNQFSLASTFTVPIENPSAIGIKDLTGDISNDFVVTGYSKKDYPLTDTHAISIIGLSPSCSFANLSLETTAPPPTISGEPATITFKATNTGPDAATYTNFTFPLPPNAYLVSAASSQGTCSGTSTVTCKLGSLGNTAQATVTIRIKTACGFQGSLSYAASVLANTPDPVTSNNSVSGSVMMVDVAPIVTFGATPVTPNTLWPPNHQMVDVVVNYSATDNCTRPPSCSLSVTSNEPVNGTGDGDTAPDWEVVSPTLVRLRAERAGSGTGRIYTVTVSCSDSANNTTSKTVTVTVPKNRSN